MMYMQKNFFPALLFLFALMLFSACGDKALTPTGQSRDSVRFNAAEWLAKDTNGIFRGAEFGDEAATIKQMENDTFLVYASEKMLQYSYSLPGQRRYTLDYKFVNGALNAFTFDIYLSDIEEADKLTTEMKTYLNKRFGQNMTEMGLYVWPLGKQEGYKESFLELSDESEEFGYGKMNLTGYALR